MNDIKTLGNKQLGVYNEIIRKKLNDLKIDILEDINDIVGSNPKNICVDEIFFTYYKKYQHIVNQNKKNILLVLTQQQHDIKNEIIARQKQLLQEINIKIPSVLVTKIMEDLQGEHFEGFVDIITYIKLALENKTNERPKAKKINIPEKHINICKYLGTNPINLIAKNEGPLPN